MQYGPVSGASGGGGGGSGLAERDTPWWVLQDGGGDVVAVVKDNGWSAGGNSATASTVAGQYVYDAFGSVLAAESLATHPALHLGHKGLFFDRLDVGVVDSGGAENPRLDQGAHATYYMRNRWYSPETGRFLQRDPNATSMVLIESAASHGRGIGAAVAALSPDAMFGDGHNLYQYLGSNPWILHDPLGTSWDPFDAVDEYLAEDSASKAAFMNNISGGFQAALHIASQLAQLNPAIGLAMSVYRLATGEADLHDFADIMGLLPGGRLLGTLLNSAATTLDVLDAADSISGLLYDRPPLDLSDGGIPAASSGAGPAQAGIIREPGPAYWNPGHHDPSQPQRYHPGREHLPRDSRGVDLARIAYSKSVGHTSSPKTRFAMHEGRLWQYHLQNGKAHWSGTLDPNDTHRVPDDIKKLWFRAKTGKPIRRR